MAVKLAVAMGAEVTVITTKEEKVEDARSLALKRDIYRLTTIILLAYHRFDVRW